MEAAVDDLGFIAGEDAVVGEGVVDGGLVFEVGVVGAEEGLELVGVGVGGARGFESEVDAALPHVLDAAGDAPPGWIVVDGQVGDCVLRQGDAHRGVAQEVVELDVHLAEVFEAGFPLAGEGDGCGDGVEFAIDGVDSHEGVGGAEVEEADGEGRGEC